MNKFSKIVLPTVLAIAMLAPVSAYAHGGKHGGPSKGMKHGKAGIHHTAKKPAHAHSGKGHFRKGGMSVMKQTLFTLLVEKYSADTLAAWEATLAEAEKTRADIKTIVTANPELKATLKTVHTEDLKAKMEENKTTRDAFEAALKAKDAEKIKASLAMILTKLQERNKVMATKLVALQKAVADKAAASTSATPAE